LGWLRPSLTIAGIFVLPVILIDTNVVPFHWRFYALALMTLVAIGIAVSRHSLESLGLTLPRLRSFLAWSVVPSAILIALVLASDLRHRAFTPEHLAFYLFFVFVSAPAQEFLYRSFLFAELRASAIPPKVIVLLSATLFAFMHIIYRDVVTVALTLVAGLIWATVFHSTRKVGIVAFSHAALGVVAIFAGVI
jgi:membrane protease YdiL (CAAX protease family)